MPRKCIRAVVAASAAPRDDIKRQALKRAGVRYREIHEGTTPDEMQRIIRALLTAVAPAA